MVEQAKGALNLSAVEQSVNCLREQLRLCEENPVIHTAQALGSVLSELRELRKEQETTKQQILAEFDQMREDWAEIELKFAQFSLQPNGNVVFEGGVEENVNGHISKEDLDAEVKRRMLIQLQSITWEDVDKMDIKSVEIYLKMLGIHKKFKHSARRKRYLREALQLQEGPVLESTSDQPPVESPVEHPMQNSVEHPVESVVDKFWRQ